MRILQIEDEPWDSGIAHYALTLSAELRSRGHEVYFWGRKDSPLLREAAAAGLPAQALRRPWAAVPLLRAQVRGLGIEVINAHTGSSHTLAAALSALLGVAVVRTRGDARRASRHPLARLLAARTQTFIAANSGIAADLSAAYPGARVVTVLQGIAGGALSPLPDEPMFGILGRLDPVKGHETLLAAAARLRARQPQARFLAVGTGPIRRREVLEAKARGLGISQAWEWAGFVPDVWSALARCRVGVVASTGSEAVSRAALEWMSAGRPVVASRVGGLADLVADGETGFLVPPGDAQALAGTLERFLEDPSLAARMGAAARRRFEARFGLVRFAEETERIYAESLQRLPS